MSLTLGLLTFYTFLGLLLRDARAQCTTTITPTNSIQPSVASGYAAAVIATGLNDPRSLEIDSAGNLLVLESGLGLSSHILDDSGGIFLSLSSSKMLINDSDVGVLKSRLNKLNVMDSSTMD